MMTYARIRNRRRKEARALTVIRFEPVPWQPQVEVTFTRDVNGWLSYEDGVKFHFAAGSTHIVDETHAVEFITKGYATGVLPRLVSQGEADEIRSAITVVGLGYQPQTRNGGDSSCLTDSSLQG